jgi:hypothetical protein
MVADEAMRLLSDQKASLDSARTRALAMLSVGSLVAGLFGSQLPKKLPAGAAPIIGIALGCFAASVVLTLIIVAPRRFRFTHSVGAQIEALEDGTEIRTRDLAFTWAKGNELNRSDNERKLNLRMTLLQVVCGLVGAQVFAWVVVALL